MNPSEVVSYAIDLTQMEGAEFALAEFPELAPHGALLKRLEELDDQLDEAELQVRQIIERIEGTADQLRHAVEAAQ